MQMSFTSHTVNNTNLQYTAPPHGGVQPESLFDQTPPTNLVEITSGFKKQNTETTCPKEPETPIPPSSTHPGFLDQHILTVGELSPMSKFLKPSENCRNRPTGALAKATATDTIKMTETKRGPTGYPQGTSKSDPKTEEKTKATKDPGLPIGGMPITNTGLGYTDRRTKDAKIEKHNPEKSETETTTTSQGMREANFF